MPEDLPVFDERVEFQGTTYLRELTSDALRTLGRSGKVVILRDGTERLSALIPYDQYVKLNEMAFGKSKEVKSQ